MVCTATQRDGVTGKQEGPTPPIPTSAPRSQQTMFIKCEHIFPGAHRWEENITGPVISSYIRLIRVIYNSEGGPIQCSHQEWRGRSSNLISICAGMEDPCHLIKYGNISGYFYETNFQVKSALTDNLRPFPIRVAISDEQIQKMQFTLSVR